MNKYVSLITFLLLANAALAQQTHKVKVAIALADCEVLSTEHPTKSQVTVYPNPTNQYLTVEHFFQQAEALLIDTSGKQVLRSAIDKPLSKINIAGLPSGFYVLQIKHQKGIAQVKILLKR